MLPATVHAFILLAAFILPLWLIKAKYSMLPLCLQSVLCCATLAPYRGAIPAYSAYIWPGSGTRIGPIQAYYRWSNSLRWRQ
jgi:hypothetical protein